MHGPCHQRGNTLFPFWIRITRYHKTSERHHRMLYIAFGKIGLTRERTLNNALQPPMLQHMARSRRDRCLPSPDSRHWLSLVERKHRQQRLATQEASLSRPMCQTPLAVASGATVQSSTKGSSSYPISLCTWATTVSTHFSVQRNK